MGIGVTIATGAVPAITPDAELTAAVAEVLVEMALGAVTRFSLIFGIDFAGGEVALIDDARLAPGAVLSVIADEGETLLARGPVIGHRIALVQGGEGSVLEVLCADGAIALDREARIKVWPEVTDSELVAQLVSDDFAPDVQTTSSRHSETQNPFVQRGSDLATIRGLARRNGFLFWVDGAPAGPDTAHFRAAPVDAEPVAVLALGDGGSALSRFELEFDVERPTSASAWGLDLADKTALSGTAAQSPLAPMADRALAALAPDTRAALPLGIANDAAGVTARAESVLAAEGFFVTARTETTAQAAGRAIRAHEVVAISGAGSAHSGNYLVGAATHRIGPAAHLITLTLIRNALGASAGGSPWSLI